MRVSTCASRRTLLVANLETAPSDARLCNLHVLAAGVSALDSALGATVGRTYLACGLLLLMV
jgi:hypothetical protein